MKLIVTTDSFLPRRDGVARFLSLLLPELAKDMDVTVFAPEFDGDVSMKGVRIIRFPLVNVQFGDIFFCKPDKSKMREAIRDADVVFNQSIGPVGQAGIKIAKRYKKPVVSYVHSFEWELARRAIKYGRRFAERFVRVLARRSYNKCSLLLVPSKKVSDVLSGNKIKTRKEVVRLGVPTSLLIPATYKPAAKRKIKIHPGKKVIGFCGRIAREKDLPTLIEAFKLVHKKHTNTVLLIVGAGLEEELPVSRNIIRTGSVEEVVPYLQAMDIFVMPSLTETSSLATMEAMSVGVPVIATPVGSIPEYIVDGENGYLFDRQNVAELVEKIDFLLTHPKMCIVIGAAARKTISKDYNWKHSAESIKEILFTLVN